MQRKLLFFVGAVVLVVATVVFLPEDFDGELFLTSLREAHPLWIVASIGATFLGYAVRALRWQTLLLPIKRIGFPALMNATTVGFGAIFALGRPGEVVRPLWIRRQESVPTMGAIASIVVERVFDLLMLLGLFALGAAWIELPEDTRQTLGGLGTPIQMLGIVVAGLAAFMILHRYAALLARVIPSTTLKRLMQTFADGLAATSTVGSFSSVMGYSVLLWCVHTLQFWCIMEGLGLSYPVAASVLTVALTSLGSVAQVPGIGGGFQAGFIVAATAILATPVEVAVAASLMVWFITTIPTIVVTGVYMMWKGISVRELRTQPAELRQPAA